MGRVRPPSRAVRATEWGGAEERGRLRVRMATPHGTLPRIHLVIFPTVKATQVAGDTGGTQS